MGDWLFEIRGIGPVLAAGIIAHIDITRARHCSSLWQYAGLNPAAVWEKGQVRPWNAKLKQVMWKVGESFVKSGGQYKHVYDIRKEYESRMNDDGKFGQQAQRYYDSLRKWAEANNESLVIEDPNKIPKVLLHKRAKKFAVRIFIQHLWVEWRKRENLYYLEVPYILAKGDPLHTHYIEHVPNERSSGVKLGQASSSVDNVDDTESFETESSVPDDVTDVGLE